MDNLQRKFKVYNGFLLLIFLNIFDGLATYIGLDNGFYIEKNSMLDFIYRHSEGMFICIKIIIPTIILLLLMIAVRDNITRVIKIMIYFGNIVYTLLFIYHIGLYSVVLKLAVY